MIVIAIVAVLAGADRWRDVERFGGAKEAWFRQSLPLPHGIPSHEAFERVFSVLDPQAFEACFRTWAEALCALIPGEIIALDGKRQRASYDANAVRAALHLVSAWATANRVVLAQVATEAKSNQNMAMPRFLALLHLEGCHVTIDTDAACSAGAVRGLWGIENTLHQTLGMNLREDACKARQPDALGNLTALRCIALPRRKQDDAKFNLRNNRKIAGRDERALQPPQLRPKAFPGLLGVCPIGGDARAADGLLQGLSRSPATSIARSTRPGDRGLFRRIGYRIVAVRL